MRLNLILLLLAFLTYQAQANKVDILAGGYSLSASTDEASGSASGLGGYKINYSFNLLNNLDMTVGYSIIMSNTFGGDLGFGFDFEFNYFPLTPSIPINSKSTKSFMTVKPLWRPLVGICFHQRQFQSVNSNYAGFGLNLGFERSMDRIFDLKGLVRYSVLGGPGSANATEILILGGITFPFSF